MAATLPPTARGPHRPSGSTDPYPRRRGPSPNPTGRATKPGTVRDYPDRMRRLRRVGGVVCPAVARGDRMLAVLSLAAYAAYVVSALQRGGDPLVELFTAPFLVGTWVAVGAYLGARRDLMVTLRDRAERAEAERELRADQARLGE